MRFLFRKVEVRYFYRESRVAVEGCEQVPPSAYRVAALRALDACLSVGLPAQRQTRKARSQFEARLRLPFPRRDPLPHAEILFQLRDTGGAHLKVGHVDLMRGLIRGRPFRRYRFRQAWPAAPVRMCCLLVQPFQLQLECRRQSMAKTTRRGSDCVCNASLGHRTPRRLLPAPE